MLPDKVQEMKKHLRKADETLTSNYETWLFLECWRIDHKLKKSLIDDFKRQEKESLETLKIGRLSQHEGDDCNKKYFMAIDGVKQKYEMKCKDDALSSWGEKSKEISFDPDGIDLFGNQTLQWDIKWNPDELNRN